MCDLNKAVADLACPAEMIARVKAGNWEVTGFIWKDFKWLAEKFFEVDGLMMHALNGARPRSGHPSTHMQFLVAPERMAFMMMLFTKLTEKIEERWPTISTGLVFKRGMVFVMGEGRKEKSSQPILWLTVTRIWKLQDEIDILNLLADILDEMKQVEHLDH